MEDQVYELWKVPMGRPAKMVSAVKSIDQQYLLDYVNNCQGYTAESLIPFIELGAKLTAIRKVKARMPHNGVLLDLVDLDSFQSEFDGFVKGLQDGMYGLDRSEIRLLLERSQRRKSYKQTIKGQVQKLLRPLISNKNLLPLVEKLCFARLDYYIKLTKISQFPAFQITTEICGLLNLLANSQPKHILEIGTCRGGTLYLFTKVVDPTAILVSLDIRIINRDLLDSFGRNRQRVILIEGDSSAPATLTAVKKIFPDGVDFLFIDGDHTYTGVKRDFDRYSTMVKPGGLIAFHDIVEDNETRYGVITGGWSGGVPRFWQEIKKDYEHEEFVNDYEQDGAGIGVLFMPTITFSEGSTHELRHTTKNENGSSS